MAGINSLLDEIWSAFGEIGIVDDFAIVRLISGCLLTMTDKDQHNVDELRPSGHEAELLRPQMAFILESLQGAADQAGGFAQLLDQYVLFRLSDMLAGVRFPTPRHVVRTMCHLVQIEAGNSIADLACGSGGFLVNSEEAGKLSLKVTGVDISPDWAALARANTMLHNIMDAHILVGNALSKCSPGGELHGMLYDRILMAPPFGLSVDPAIAKDAIEHDIGSRSETSFVALALHQLEAGGRAIFLVPSGFLFRNNLGDSWLRRKLIDSYETEAVISLPKDALQPFSSLPTHVLLMRKRNTDYERPWKQTWFFRTEFDGYPAGRGRDLTKLPDGQSDLPFVEESILSHHMPFNEHEVFPKGEDPLIGVRKISGQEGLPNIMMQALNGARVAIIERLRSKDEGKLDMLLVEVVNEQTRQRIHIHITLDKAGDVYEEKRSRNELVSKYSTTTLFRGDEIDQAIAIRDGDRLLGISISSSTIAARSYDLRPDQYLERLEEQSSATAYSDIVDHLRENHFSFLKQIDRLSLRKELLTASLRDMVSEVQQIVEPPTSLSNEQQEVWNRILEITKENVNLSFTQQQLRVSGIHESSKQLILTLELFERMGLIIPVTKLDQRTLQPEDTYYYRRVTAKDEWNWSIFS
jgi:SAM-dependent methyltransferase